VTVNEGSFWLLWNLVIHYCIHKNLLLVYSRYSFSCLSGFSFILRVVCDKCFHVIEMVTCFCVAVFWSNRGMVLFGCPKTCRVIIRYVFLVLFSLQMQLDEVLNELEANDFGDLVRKCMYH
jgi:hypothetical protein